MEISAKELRSHTKLFLDAVERGEDITITYRGRPRARVVRIDTAPAESSPTDSPLFGMWADRNDLDDPAEHVRELRRGRYR